MAKRRKKRASASVGRRRSSAYKRVNPRRRRSSPRRRRNPTTIVARGHGRRVSRRRVSQRRNPSALRVGQILKDMIYGAGGAIVTRATSQLAQGFVPGAFAGNPLTGPVLQAAVAVTVVRWGGKKFLGQQQGDIMMLGGLISAGLALADQYVPNLQNQLTGIVRAPVVVAPGVIEANGNGAVGALAGMRDVEEVEGFAGLGDVEELTGGQLQY